MPAPQLRVVEGDIMDKQKALEAALAQIDKHFGKGSVMRLGANDRNMDVEAISTGSLGLDIALGIGGLPRGRVVEIYGPEFVRQDHAGAPGRGGSPEKGWHRRLRGRRARARPRLCQEARGQGRGSADLAAGHRRGGAGDRRHAGALGRHRRAGGRTRWRPSHPRPSSKARWATCSPACRRAS